MLQSLRKLTNSVDRRNNFFLKLVFTAVIRNSLPYLFSFHEFTNDDNNSSNDKNMIDGHWYEITIPNNEYNNLFKQFKIKISKMKQNSPLLFEEHKSK